MRLFRISNILSFAVATVFGFLLFWTSQAVQQKEGQFSDVRHKLDQENETIRVLSVEWDYLNRPQRLEQLARDQLGMEQPSVKEIARNVNDIPVPMEEDGITQAVSLVPEVKESPKPEIVSPSKAEKQNFETLIQNLNTGAGE